MIKDKLKPEIDPLDNYQGKWVNVWFNSKGAEKHVGHSVYETEISAKMTAEEQLRIKLQSVKFHGGAFEAPCITCNKVELYDESCFAIQMPIGE